MEGEREQMITRLTGVKCTPHVPPTATPLTLLTDSVYILCIHFLKCFFPSQSLFALVACSLAVMSAAAPSGLAVPLTAPVVAPVAAVAAPAPVVTAYSSQYVARNYNGIAVAPAVVPSAAVVGYPAAVYAPHYAAGPLVEEYLF